MYVYDVANNLAKTIQESKEYKEYKSVKEELKSDLEMKAKIDKFEKIRYEVQVMSFQGEKQDEEKMKKLQEMYEILMKEPKIKEYFDIEVRFNIMLADVNKIISESTPEDITVMVQKEVGDRFMSQPNSRNYGSLSVFLQYNFDVTRVVNVNKRCFEPVPKVDSVVVKLTKNKKYEAKDEEKFYKLVKDSFTQKRKNLRNNLRNYNLEKIEEIDLIVGNTEKVEIVLVIRPTIA